MFPFLGLQIDKGEYCARYVKESRLLVKVAGFSDAVAAKVAADQVQPQPKRRGGVGVTSELAGTAWCIFWIEDWDKSSASLILSSSKKSERILPASRSERERSKRNSGGHSLLLPDVHKAFTQTQ